VAEATIDFVVLTARLEAAPFQDRTAIEFSANCSATEVASAQRVDFLSSLFTRRASLAPSRGDAL